MKFKCECEYCNEISYSWVLDNKIVWVEIPKNATVSLKQFLFNFENYLWQDKIPQPYSRISPISPIEVKNYKRGFLVLRNPIDRFKSMLSHYFIDGYKFDSGTQWIKNLTNLPLTSDNIGDIVLNNWEYLNNITEPHHFNSQYSFIPSSFFNLNNHILDCTEVNKYFNLPIVNTSSSKNIYLSKKNLELVENIYKEDFILYDTYIGL